MKEDIAAIEPSLLDTVTGGWGWALAGVALGAAALGHQIWASGQEKGIADRGACPAPTQNAKK